MSSDSPDSVSKYSQKERHEIVVEPGPGVIKCGSDTGIRKPTEITEDRHVKSS